MKRSGHGSGIEGHKFLTAPDQIRALLNDRLQGRGLVTCQALRVQKDGKASLANAGHQAPYLNGRELEMEGALPLGAISSIEYPVTRFQINEGDTRMRMTDGIAEAQNAEGHLLGFDRVEQMLREKVTALGLADAAQSFGQEDDRTVPTWFRRETQQTVSV